MYQYATLGDTVYFWFASNDTGGSANDGASSAADVRLQGAASSASPVLSPSPTLLTSSSYPSGCYEVAISATTGNGFAAGSGYAVFSTLAVDSQNPVGMVGAFTLNGGVASEATLVTVSGDVNSVQTDVTTIAADVVNIDGSTMRGTDNAALATNLATVSGNLDTVSTNVSTVLTDVADMSGQMQTEHDATQSTLSGLNDVSITDIVASGNAENWNSFSDATLANQTTIINNLATTSGNITTNLDATVSSRASATSLTTTDNTLNTVSGDINSMNTTVDVINATTITVSGVVRDNFEILNNKLEIVPASSILRLWDTAGTSIIRQWNITDKDGSNISLQVGPPANRDPI